MRKIKKQKYKTIPFERDTHYYKCEFRIDTLYLHVGRNTIYEKCSFDYWKFNRLTMSLDDEYPLPINKKLTDFKTKFIDCSFPPDLEILDRHIGKIENIQFHGLEDHATELYICGANSISGIDKYNKLKRIDFSESKFTDIDVLGNIPDIDTVFLSGCHNIKAIPDHLSKNISKIYIHKDMKFSSDFWELSDRMYKIIVSRVKKQYRRY